MIRIGIAGYGNLGRGAALAAAKNPDMRLCAVFSRRDPSAVILSDKTVPVYRLEDAPAHRDEIDVLLVCGGSATDLPEMTPALAADFNVIDSFDTHANIPAHFEAVDRAAKASGHIGIISVGWDPGLFSVARVLGLSVLPGGAPYTFWGRGVSQGHSDAIRRIEGVADARQYTVPKQEAINAVRAGEYPTLTPREKHARECYVVAKDGADREKIAETIRTMPHYFDEYDTTVDFISQKELNEKHGGIPHGGVVLVSAKTGSADEHLETMEFSLKLDSNPEFTASVLTAYARAAYRLAHSGVSGCKTVLDIAPALLSPLTPEELRARYL